ncbi:MAG: hypothetical protein HY958_09220 [Bacteroidia bacterium]|nr:hypothetical protein [Bacteroidia bacterium]
MKRLIIVSIFQLIIISSLIAQNESDALRYSQTVYGGTARFTAMGGAFGALGADFSVLAINPAGIALYRSSELSFTPSLFYNKTKTYYLDNASENNDYSFKIGNLGFVSTYKSDYESNDWKSTSFGIGYIRTNCFANEITIEGNNSKNSMIDFFVNRANGNKIDNLDSYMEGLAFDTWLIDTIAGSATHYKNPYSNNGANYGELQRKDISTNGSIGEYIFSLGSNYRHKLYIGAALSIHKLNYEEVSMYTETAPGDTLTNLSSFSYKQDISTSGTGYSFKIGVIARPIDWIRIGGAIHTPTFYNLEDSYSSAMKVNLEDGNMFSSSSENYKSAYELTTPMKAVGSVGFIINKIAVLGIDYEFVDYSTASLKDAKHDYPYTFENKAVNTSYKAASNIRAGVEYAFGTFRIRCGYAYYGSPYKSSQINKNANMMSFSGGFGIKNENMFLDFAFVHSVKTEYYYLYYLQNISDTEPSKITSNSNQLLFTLGYKF